MGVTASVETATETAAEADFTEIGTAAENYAEAGNEGDC